MGNRNSSSVITHFEPSCPIQHIYTLREFFVILWKAPTLVALLDCRTSAANFQDIIPEFARLALRSSKNIPFVVIDKRIADKALVEYFQKSASSEKVPSLNTLFSQKIYIRSDIPIHLLVIENSLNRDEPKKIEVYPISKYENDIFACFEFSDSMV